MFFFQEQFFINSYEPYWNFRPFLSVIFILTAIESTPPACKMTTMEKTEFSVLIKHYFLRGKTITQTKASLDKYYGDSSPSVGTIHRWFTEFRCDRTSTSDAECSGCPNEVATPGMVDRGRSQNETKRNVKMSFQEIDDFRSSEGWMEPVNKELLETTYKKSAESTHSLRKRSRSDPGTSQNVVRLVDERASTYAPAQSLLEPIDLNHKTEPDQTQQQVRLKS